MVAAAGDTACVELEYLPAADVLELFASMKLSPVEYLVALATRIEQVNPLVNALVDTYLDEALASARSSEARYARRVPLGPLDGLPVAIKDETPISGRRTTSGSKVFRDHVDDRNAVVVDRILAAGGYVHARTATPEFCCVPFTHSDLWGVTRNPWNLDYSPGGSSGGAGAALAAGMSPLADGSDVGGSIRIPAGFCGVVGYKPPYGRVPGVPPYNLDPYCVQGPMARTVGDCALLQDVFVGPHRDDAATVPGRSKVAGTDSGISGWRVAVSFDCGGFPTSGDVRHAVQQAAEALEQLGADVEEVPVGWTFEEVQRAAHIHTGITFGADVAALGREHPELLTAYARKVAQRADEIRKEDYTEGVQLEGRIQRALATIMADHRVLLCPAVSTHGFIAGHDYVDVGPDVDGLATAKHRDVMPTLIFNICNRNPVITVPVGVSSVGVPIGMQIVGRPFDDDSVFVLARALEEAAPWPLALGIPPSSLPPPRPTADDL